MLVESLWQTSDHFEMNTMRTCTFVLRANLPDAEPCAVSWADKDGIGQFVHGAFHDRAQREPRKLSLDTNNVNMNDKALPSATHAQSQDQGHSSDMPPPPWRPINTRTDIPMIPTMTSQVDDVPSTFGPRLVEQSSDTPLSRAPSPIQKTPVQLAAPRFPTPPPFQPTVYHPVPQTPIRFEDQTRRWAAQWAHQAHLLGILPATQSPSPAPSQDRMVAMLQVLHKGCDERVVAVQAKLSRIERELRERVAALEGREASARREVGQLKGWKAEVERRVQMQIDVVSEVVRRVIATEDMVGEVRTEVLQERGARLGSAPRDEGTHLGPGFPSPLSEAVDYLSGVVDSTYSNDGLPMTVDSICCDDGLPDYLPSRETTASPNPYADLAPPSRSTGKKVVKKRRKFSVVSLPPVPETSPTISGPTNVDLVLRPSRPLTKDPELKSLQTPKMDSGSKLQMPARILPPTSVPAETSNDPAPTVRVSSLLTTLSDGTAAPIFAFNKHPETVREQWDEYEYGLAGQRAVRLLDERYTTKWRRDTYARTWYSRRKRFWGLCKELLKRGFSEDEMVAKIERFLAAKEMTVAGFVDWLRQEKHGVEIVLSGPGANAGFATKDGETKRGVKRKKARRHLSCETVDGQEVEEEVAMLSESEEDERAQKRRSSLNLRGRAVLARPPFEESSDDSDSILGDC
ncbi:High-osmolarity-induced transcription protein 1 like [Verticillium longisporum]|nr:High-osmolarity-induced transcription protein 1 like [Verticillium longisporum]